MKKYTYFLKNSKTLDVEYSQKENTYSLNERYMFPLILKKSLRQILSAHSHFIKL